MSKNTKQGQRKTSAQTQVPAVVTSAKRKETHGNVAAVNVAKLGKKKGKNSVTRRVMRVAKPQPRCLSRGGLSVGIHGLSQAVLNVPNGIVKVKFIPGRSAPFFFSFFFVCLFVPGSPR